MNLFHECCTLSPADRLRLAGWLVRSVTPRSIHPPPHTVDGIKRAIRREQRRERMTKKPNAMLASLNPLLRGRIDQHDRHASQ